MKIKPSINDIASQLSISKTTVSFILNGKAKEKRISDNLVKRVLDLVEEVGYKPNQFAQSLRTGRTKIIGLMVEDISNPFFAHVAKHIEEKAFSQDYKIIYCSTENNETRAREFLTMFMNLGVDGYIITPTNGLEKDVEKLLQQGANVILFDRYFKDLPTDVVMVDNEDGAYIGTMHLIDQGYSNVACITLSSEQPQMIGRANGYKKAVLKNKMTPLIFSLEFQQNFSCYTADIKKILLNHPSIDAIFFGTNYLGVQGLEVIADIGRAIPESLGMVSFDDNDLFRLYQPPITVVAQPIEEMSQILIDTLLERLSEDKKNEVTTKMMLPATLLIRKSSIRKKG